MCITPCPDSYYGVFVARFPLAGVRLLLHLPAGSRELYAYTADLLTLDLCRCPAPTAACSWLGGVQTSLLCRAWEAALAGHPDRAFARYVTRGIREGFRIGFHRSRPLRSAACNMLSAYMHPEVIQAFLDKECAAGHMLGPFSAQALGILPPLHVIRFGVIPKGHDTGKWRLITDLSYPPGLSVNDGIDPELFLLTYMSVDAVAEVAVSYPPGALLAKVDIVAGHGMGGGRLRGSHATFWAPFGPQNMASIGTFAAAGSVMSPITWMTLSSSARHAHRNTPRRWLRWTMSAPSLGPPSRSTNETAQPPVSHFSALR